MGFLDRLLGRDQPRATATPRGSGGGELTDEQALERYRYLVRTAPPERIEEAHEEAFARLTPEQRAQALQELTASVPGGERADGEDPRSLARMATRAELREPGSVERALGRGGIGAAAGATLLGTFAAAFAATIAAQALMDELGPEGERGAEPAGAEGGDGGGGGAGDSGGFGGGGGDFGGGMDAGGGF
jgi:Spy/CpxP family protein refolding chaperone